MSVHKQSYNRSGMMRYKNSKSEILHNGELYICVVGKTCTLYYMHWYVCVCH